MGRSYIPSKTGVALGDHTADVWLEVNGPDMDNFIERALHGLYSVMADEFNLGSSVQSNESFPSERLELLLVDILSEALFLFDSESSLIMEPRLGPNENGDVVLSFKKVECEIVPGKAGMEVKAVTFHGAELIEDDGGWRGKFLLDL
jgi:SHS2 domain-containing protein